MVVAITATAVVTAACTPSADDGTPATTGRPTTTTTPPRGGSVRVGVWMAPDVDAPTLGGAAVRALVLPQLFVAAPDGRWVPSLVQPGSDRAAADRLSSTFRLRPGASWSDGIPITADDLRRSADGRFVAGVDGPDASGLITVRFTQPLPEWRRLWSFTDAVAAPGPGIWGGPFVVAATTPGLETVLARNDRWWGAPAPYLDEVRLVLVPDSVIARELLGRGELDVVMPPESTVRTEQLEGIAGVDVRTAPQSGWWTGVVLNADRLSIEARRGVIASIDRVAFRQTLLVGEAAPLEGFAGAADTTWIGSGGSDHQAVDGLKETVVDLIGPVELPAVGTLHRAMQRRAAPAGGRIELRGAEADRVDRWLAERTFGAALVTAVEPPSVCWRCRWDAAGGDIPALAGAADTGDTAAVVALEARLRDDALALPLWRPSVVVAARTRVAGIEANGYALNGAWNAATWWVKPG